ncbi:MinD/ParA family protein [Fusibacter ferrireducens]|uniref:MinD/ParA family protein n=1 Tax=Fusibacter ferrireducens TaxID=2785058 RepID=A0ABR9ZN53_9FIRM|nr:MinD/ParA family protein [Fusibacter ferrireducens]MBF4691746.1 MinD/ParA family protein [Fusibacter ferrireducens]
MDQAQKLRDIVQENSPESANRHDARIITVSSGKGGVGKTNFTVNMAIALAKLKKRVTIIDADLGLANVDVLFGIVPKYNLSHVVKGEIPVQDCIFKGPYDINIISGGSGIMDLIDLDQNQLEKLIHSLLYFNDVSDYILIDTGAGLSKSVLSFVDAASDVIVVITPDPTSITDAYALIKNIVKEDDKKIKLIINRVDSNEEGDEVFNKLEQAVSKFLSKELENMGYIFEDSNLKKAVRKQMPVIEAYPRAISSKGIENIAYNLDNNSKYVKSAHSFKTFINKLINKI